MASIKDLKRMCKMQTCCAGCPLSKEDISCQPDLLPNNIDEMVDKWVAEHPVKTYADDFFEKFPDAQRMAPGIPVPCVVGIYSEFSDKNCPVGGCQECWNQKMEISRPASNTETCVCCGAEIPEGRQVCPACERKDK